MGAGRLALSLFVVVTPTTAARNSRSNRPSDAVPLDEVAGSRSARNVSLRLRIMFTVMVRYAILLQDFLQDF